MGRFNIVDLDSSYNIVDHSYNIVDHGYSYNIVDLDTSYNIVDHSYNIVDHGCSYNIVDQVEGPNQESSDRGGPASLRSPRTPPSEEPCHYSYLHSINEIIN